MSQTPVEEDSVMFNQLAAEYAIKGESYDDLVNWSVPEFEWDPTRRVVQLDKPRKRGVNITKVKAATDAFDVKLSDVPQITDAQSRTGRVSQYVKSTDGILSIGDIVHDYISMVGQDFAANHPLAVVTDMHSETNDDGSVTVVYEAVQPITSVKPLSEKNTANPME
jgi:hypothetical protein